MGMMLACIDAKGGLGFEGKMAWHVPSEFGHFKMMTMGRRVGVGSGTKLPPLTGRTVVPLSRSDDLAAFDGIIIGGAAVFASCLGVVQTLVISVLPDAYECDCFLDWGRVASLYELTREVDAGDFRILTWELKDATG